MADDENSGAPAAKGKGGLMPTILAVAVLTVLAGGAGALTGTMLGSETGAHVAEAAAAAPAAEAEAAKPAEGKAAAVGDHGAEGEGEPAEPAITTLVPMKPIITNIAAPADVVVRLESSVVLSGETEDQALLVARIEADTATFLRTVQLAQLEGARGITHLREDLVERARMRSSNVADVLIQTLVAE